MSADLTRATDSLRTHAWVDDARCGSARQPGIALLLNKDGVEALCRLGRESLLDNVQRYIREHGYVGSSPIWRLVDVMPVPPYAQAIDAVLQTPLPRDALLLNETQQEGIWTLALRVPLDLAHFPGHFPQAPVLPGAVQVGWALAFAAKRLGTAPRCHAMEALKFQQLLRPGDRADLTLRYDASRQKLHFAYRYGDKAYSSGRLA